MTDASNQFTHAPVPPPSIESFIPPDDTIDPITLGAARWVIKFSEPVRIDIDSSGADVANAVDADTGAITGASIFAPATATDTNSGGNQSEAITTRAFNIRRCTSATTNSCSNMGETATGRTSLWTDHYRVYTTDLQTISGNEYGTTFVFQMRSLGGFAAGNRLQFIVSDTMSITNQATGTLTTSDIPTTGGANVVTRPIIQTQTNAGSADNNATRVGTIFADTSAFDGPSNIEFVPASNSVRATISFSHHTANVTAADFTIASENFPNTRYGIGTVLPGLSFTQTNPVYIFTAPIVENSDTTAPHNIELRWTPRDGITHTATVAAAGNSFSFPSTSPDNLIASHTTAQNIGTIADTSPPTILSLSPDTSATTAANNRAVTWVVTFDEPVSGLQASNLSFSYSNDANGNPVTGITTSASSATAQNPTSGRSSVWHIASTTPITSTSASSSGVITATLDSGSVTDANTNTLDITGSTTNNSTTLDWTVSSSVSRIQRMQAEGSVGTGFFGGTVRRDGNPPPPAELDTLARTDGTRGNPFSSDTDFASFGIDINATARTSNGASVAAITGATSSYSIDGRISITCEIVGTPAATCGNFATDLVRFGNTSSNSYRVDKTAAISAIPDGRIAKFTVDTLYRNGRPFSNIATPTLAQQELNVFYFAHNAEPPTATVTSTQSTPSPRTRTITYEVEYPSPLGEQNPLLGGFTYMGDAPSGATSATDRTSYAFNFTCRGAGSCSHSFTSATVTRSGSVDTVVLNLGNVLDTQSFDVQLRVGTRPITADFTTQPTATVSINPPQPVDVQFGTAESTSYSITFPITFDPAIPNLDTGADADLFKIESTTGGNATNLVLTNISSGTETSVYTITGFLPGTPGTTPSSLYTATFTPTAPINISSGPNAGRMVTTTPVVSDEHTVDYPNIPAPALVDITLDQSTLPNVNAMGAANFIATFNHPVSGVLFSHFEFTANSGFSSTPGLAAAAGRDVSRGGVAAISDGTNNYFTQWVIPSANFTRVAANESITIASNIDTTAKQDEIIPIGGATRVLANDGTISFVGDFDGDITPPTILIANRSFATDNANFGLSDPDEATAGGVNRWLVVFTEDVTGVDASDFAINQGISVTSVEPVASSDSNYLITATLPDTGFDTDTPIILSLASSNSATLDIKDTANNLFVPIDITVALQNPPTLTTTIAHTTTGVVRNYILNTDNDPITLTVTRNDPETQAPRVNGTIQEVSWTLTFDKPVEGVDVTGSSDQFGIKIGGGNVGSSRDSANFRVFVTAVSPSVYTATVALPQSSYPTDTVLSLATRDVGTPLSAISQVDNSHTKSILLSTDTSADLTDPAVVLTNDTNSYTINTGALTVASITSATGTTPRTAVFTITFNARVNGLTSSNFSLLQSDGTTALTGTTAPTITNSTIAVVGGSDSRNATASITDTGTYSYTWRVTTLAIADGEEPRLTMLNITNIDPEGENNAGDLTLPTGDDAFHNHEFRDETRPTITDITRLSSNNEITSGGTIEWSVRFSEEIVGFDTGGSDFVITLGTGSTATTLTTNNVSYLITGGIFTFTNTLVVEVTLPDNGFNTDTPVTLSLASTTGITDSSTNNPANPAVVPATNPPTYEGNGLAVPTNGVITGAEQFILNTNTVTTTFGTPFNDGYSISFPVTFTPPVTLSPNFHAGFFDIRNSANVELGEPGIVPGTTSPSLVADPDVDGRYIVSAFLQGTPGQGSLDTHMITFTPPTSPIIFGNAAPNLGARLTTGDTTTHDVNFPNLETARLVSIELDRTTIPTNVGDSGALEFIVTFNYPVRVASGNLGQFNAVFEVSSTETTFTPTPNLASISVRGAPITSGGEDYYSQWTITTASITRATGSTIALVSGLITGNSIAAAAADVVNPIGPLTGIELAPAGSPVTSTGGVFDIATAPFVSGVTLGNVTNPAAANNAGTSSIRWIITFDQEVRGVLASHFDLVTTTPAGVPLTNPAIDNGTDLTIVNFTDDTNFAVISTDLPAEGINVPTIISLRLNSTASAIMGAEGPDRDDTTQMTRVRLDPTDTNHDLLPLLNGTRIDWNILNNVKLDSFTGTDTDQSNRTQEFTATFSRPVEGLTLANFTVATLPSGGLTTTATAPTVSPTDPNSWIINTTTGDAGDNLAGISVELTLNDLNNVTIPSTPTEFNRGSVTALGTARTATQGFVATAPEVSSVVLGSTANQSSGDITWTIMFNQAVTNVSASHFDIVSTSPVISSITPTISPSDGSSSNTFTLTLSGIPSTGIDVPTEVSLALDNSAIAILGAEGPNPNTPPVPAMISLPLVLPASLALSATHSGSAAEYSILNDARITSFIGTDTDQATGEQEFTVTFSREVTGLTMGLFSVTDSRATPNTTITGFTPALTTASSSYVVATMTTGTTIGTTVTLSIANLNNVTATNSANTSVTNFTTAMEAPQGFIATPPLLTTATLVGGPMGVSGDIGWQVEFNQAVTGISSGNFDVVAIPDSSLITGRPLSIMGSGNTYTLTLSGIPASGIDVSTEIFLRLNSSAVSIMGSSGPRSIIDSTVITRPLELSTVSHNTQLSGARHMILNDARYISLDRSGVDRDNALQFFTLTFSRPVTGLTPSDFSVVIGDTNPAGLISTVTDVSVTTGDPNSLTITTSTPSTLAQREDRFAILTLSSLSNARVATGMVTQLPSGTSLTARQSLLGRLVNGITVPPDATVIEVTEELTESFVERRAAQILTSSPALSTRLVRTTHEFFFIFEYFRHEHSEFFSGGN